jgi:hypothetical protein
MVAVVATRLVVPAALRLHHEMSRGWMQLRCERGVGGGGGGSGTYANMNAT